MAAVGSAESETPVPTTETELPAASESKLAEEELQAMHDLLSAVYGYRTEGGEYDPSHLFHRRVNKRHIPDYYEIVKEPMALSNIKSKLNQKGYKDIPEFVRDFALISHNAQLYNRPDSAAYQDAVTIKTFVESELKKLVDSKVISEEDAKMPYLGEIPPQDDPPVAAEDEDDEEDDDDEEEDEDGEESDESRAKRRGRGRPRKSEVLPKRENASKEEITRVADIDPRKKRGRPPRVDTPEEARIKNILKGMRRFKNSEGQAKASHFERLPDRAVMPEYFNLIKAPMAMDVLKKKMKRKKYQSVDQFMKDVEQMFENAKRYNEDDSQIFKDAVELQEDTRKLAEEERAKKDTDFVMEDGRLPLPNGILHNGELFKIGDWVHIQNPNDLTKPLVAQIYRTWQDASNNKFINACWYYRPEQTVHRFDKHFFENEVVKTGQYRDHAIDEIVDRCFVMFITRYNKGRPRQFPLNKDIYVCEARYNEEKHTLNKIKTWASCLPDEVRDKDYEMDMFPEAKKMKKLVTPIAYLIKDDAKETDELPKPEWGAENAPPKIGAVHRRPRDPKESPPPEPTPSPPPKEPTPPPPPPPAPTMASQTPNGYRPNNYSNQPPRQATTATSVPQASQNIPSQRPYAQQITPAAPARAPDPRSTFSPQVATPGYAARNLPESNLTPQSNNRYPPLPAQSYAPPYKNAQQPIEVWSLNDAANASIPPDIRQQFHRDEFGRVLFFTSPPLEVIPSEKEGAALGHSASFLVAKKKRDELVRQKRLREETEAQERAEVEAKRSKSETDHLQSEMARIQARAVELLGQQLARPL